MKNLTGTWEGEYSINIGTDEDPTIEHHTFRLELNDQDGELNGTAKDLTLSNESSKIKGFHEDGYVSFIKKYDRLVFSEEGEYFGDDTAEHPDIHYSGTFKEDENCYQGNWEIKEEEEQIGLQESFEVKYFIGSWYMRRLN